MSNPDGSVRLKNSRRNIISGFLNLLVATVLPFINRTIIIHTLGSEFTGLSDLFSSILEVLNIAEFGFSVVIVYYLYEPLAQNDTDTINRIMTWIRKVYNLVGGAIFIGGLITAPFLTRLIHGTYPEEINIYIVFLIYVLNSGLSYFLFAYKETILVADQRKDILSNINTGIKISVNLLQFAALLIFKNYYLYLIMLVVGTAVSNLWVNRTVNHRYPYLKIVNHAPKLPKTMRKELVGLMVNRLSNVSRNAFDSIIISSTLGLVATSIYKNYYMIYTAVVALTSVFTNSVQASIGNSIAVRTEEENYQNLLDFSLLYSWIAGWCSVTMACLYQPFMKLWVGDALMLTERDMLLFVAYFYLINMNHMRNQYIFGNAFWWKLKWAYLAEAFGNLILNIILGKLFGITGILIATILTIFICNYLMCNDVLFKNYFKHENIWEFYKQQFYYLLAAAVAIAVTYLLCRNIESIVLRGVICIFLPNVMFFVMYRPCSRWKSSMTYVKRVLKIR